jgi:hypothetical protein
MYTIYNPNTYRMLRVIKNGYWQDAQYATQAAAKAQLTKLSTGLRPKIKADEWKVISMDEYRRNEPEVEVISIGSGKPVKIKISACGNQALDPSMEGYWSM